MTKLTITRERLEKIKSWRETYGAGSNVMLPAEEAEELARMVLSAMDSEPIGAFHISDGTVEATTDYCKDGEWPIQNGILEVYANPVALPQAPVADNWPDKLTWSHHDDMTQAEVLAWNNAIDACRAAMLNGGKS